MTACKRCRAASIALAIAAGALFGAGLIISGMTQPARVVGFLDPISGWDPTLAFVMAGAVAVYALAFRLIRKRRGDPWFDVTFHVPSRTDLDLQLVLGAALFGIGWGLAGLCPGPALVAGASGLGGAVIFVLAMLGGAYAARAARSRLT